MPRLEHVHVPVSNHLYFRKVLLEQIICKSMLGTGTEGARISI